MSFVLISANAAVASSYDYALVALSVLMAVSASYAALAGRATAASGWIRSAWLSGVAAMGLGIWLMHFIGVLAFSLPAPVAYVRPIVLLTLLSGVLSSAFALWRAQTRVESVLDSVVDTHILLDRGWHYLYVNRAAARGMGRSGEQILGRTLWDLYPDIVGTELERQYLRAMEEQVPVAFDFYYRTTNTWWANRFYPAPEGLSVFATDITERKRAEQELQEAQAELARLIRVATVGELTTSITR
jgi:PAS domain S-box-containing protein